MSFNAFKPFGNPLKSFEIYAEAFEVGYESRDWQVVADLMAEDVSWTYEIPPPIGGTRVGRDQVIEAIRHSVDTLDRRFDLRAPEVRSAPTAFPGGIYVPWRVSYTRHGLPPAILVGEEWDLFRDGKMVMHYERFWNLGEFDDFLKRHHSALLPV